MDVCYVWMKIQFLWDHKKLWQWRNNHWRDQTQNGENKDKWGKIYKREKGKCGHKCDESFWVDREECRRLCHTVAQNYVNVSECWWWWRWYLSMNYKLLWKVTQAFMYNNWPVLCQAFQGCRVVEFQYVLEQVGSQSVGTHAIDEEQPVPCAPPDLHVGKSQCKDDPCHVNDKR